MPQFAEQLRFRLFKWFKPFMVSGFHSADGVFRSKVRVSNTTAILHPNFLTIGEGVFIGHHNLIDASGGLFIGEGVQITNFVSVLTHSSHQAIRLYGDKYTLTSSPVAYRKLPVHIGEYTFIGPHSVIMPGARIGKGAVVAAYSLVKGEVSDFSIVAGNPAVKVGDTRESDRAVINQNPELLESYQKWASKQW